MAFSFTKMNRKVAVVVPVVAVQTIKVEKLTITDLEFKNIVCTFDIKKAKVNEIKV